MQQGIEVVYLLVQLVDLIGHSLTVQDGLFRLFFEFESIDNAVMADSVVGRDCRHGWGQEGGGRG